VAAPDPPRCGGCSRRGAVRQGIIGLRRPLFALKATSPQAIYYRTDSHWNNIGWLALIEQALPPLSPRVRVQPSEIVNTGNARFSGDLLVLLGQSGSELAPTRAIRRAPGAPVVPGRTVMIGDSCARTGFAQVHPYFSSISLIEWTESTLKQQIDGIVGARNVVLETVEREVDFRASNMGYANPPFIALVRSALAAHPLPRGGR